MEQFLHKITHDTFAPGYNKHKIVQLTINHLRTDKQNYEWI